jgi:NAD(P)H-nitrite reductase large subunit
MDKDVIICRCEELTYGEILAAIADGARTVGEVKRRTRAGMGLCQGKTCGLLVRRILAEQLGQPVSEIQPMTQRPPVRPLAIGILAQPEDA